LAALAIYGVRKYMSNAKSAEAKNSLGQLTKDASAAYNREHMAAAILDDTKAAGVSNAICKSAGDSIPDDIAKVKGQKYQSAASEWDAGDKDTGWACLKFSMAEPQYYMYNYQTTTWTGADGDKFDATAEGDLDGDGVPSTFKMQGEVRAQQVVVSPTIDETAPEKLITRAFSSGDFIVTPDFGSPSHLRYFYDPPMSLHVVDIGVMTLNGTIASTDICLRLMPSDS
jgi:type IV pilus assembly protein PilA